DVLRAAWDVGWVLAASSMVEAPPVTGCSTILYEGKPVRTPDAGAFWRVCAEYGVKGLFAAPTASRAIRKEDPECTQAGKYDLSKLKTIFMAGERLDQIGRASCRERVWIGGVAVSGKPDGRRMK